MNAKHLNLLSPEEAAKYLNVKLSKIRSLILHKEIDYFKVNHLVRIPESSLIQFLERNKVENEK